MIKWGYSGKAGFLLLALGILLSGSLLSSSLVAFLDSFGNFFGASVRNAWSYFVAVILTGLVFFKLSSLAYDLADELISSTAKMTREDNASRCKYLVMGYSVINNDRDKRWTGSELKELIQKEADKFGLEHVAQEKTKYDSRCDALRKNHRNNLPPAKALNPWQQNARAMFAHIKPDATKENCILKKILILRPNRDETCFRDFRKYMEKLAEPYGVIVEQVTMPRTGKPYFIVDDDIKHDNLYESFKYTFGGVTRAMEMLFDEEGETDDLLVCVDATPGQKSFSIGAAVATLNRKAIFSYVTNDGKVITYDARISLGRAPQ